MDHDQRRDAWANSEFPREPIRRLAFDSEVPSVHPAQVVGAAEAHEVLELVPTALRAKNDVVRVHRGSAAAGNLAMALVAFADPGR